MQHVNGFLLKEILISVNKLRYFSLNQLKSNRDPILPWVLGKAKMLGDWSSHQSLSLDYVLLRFHLCYTRDTFRSCVIVSLPLPGSLETEERSRFRKSKLYAQCIYFNHLPSTMFWTLHRAMPQECHIHLISAQSRGVCPISLLAAAFGGSLLFLSFIMTPKIVFQ